MVISRVYAGGGNSGAPTNDFVELFNRGSSAIDLGSWSIRTPRPRNDVAGDGPWAGSARRYSSRSPPQRRSACRPRAGAVGTSNLAVSGGKVAAVRGTPRFM
jgi:hypothetical protein